MKVWLLDKAWYIAFWVLVFVAARLWLVNPVVKALEKLHR